MATRDFEQRSLHGIYLNFHVSKYKNKPALYAVTMAEVASYHPLAEAVHCAYQLYRFAAVRPVRPTAGPRLRVWSFSFTEVHGTLSPRISHTRVGDISDLLSSLLILSAIKIKSRIPTAVSRNPHLALGGVACTKITKIKTKKPPRSHFEFHLHIHKATHIAQRHTTVCGMEHAHAPTPFGI